MIHVQKQVPQSVKKSFFLFILLNSNYLFKISLVLCNISVSKVPVKLIPYTNSIAATDH